MIPRINLLRIFMRPLGALIISTLCASFAFGQQTAARPDRGFMRGASYSESDIENISLTNGNVNLSIPLASLPPIAGSKLKLTLSAVYNSKLWNITRTEHQLSPLAGCANWTVDNPQLNNNGGWTVSGSYQIAIRNAHADFDYVQPDPPPSATCESDVGELGRLQYQYYRIILITPDGAEHELRPLDTNNYYGISGGTRSYLFNYYRDTPLTTNTTMRYYSFDGSFIYASITSQSQWTVYLNDGTKVQTSDGVQRVMDTNGNSVKIFTDADGTHYQDEQTGREIRLYYDPDSTNLRAHVQYQTVGGVPEIVDINYGTTLVQGKVYRVNDWNPSGGESGGGAPCFNDQPLTLGSNGVQMSVIREIVFPVTEPGQPGRRFSFSYNSDTTESASDQVIWSCGSASQSYTRTVSHGMGDLSQMTTPSGAIVNYTYSRDGVHRYVDDDSIPRETITQKQVVHDGVTDTWSYTIDEPSGISGGVTAPDESTTTETKYPQSPATGMLFGPNLDKAGLVYRSNRSDKEVVERHWTTLAFSGANTGPAGANSGLVTFNPVVDAEYTTLKENGVAVKMSAKTYQYDYNGNLLSQTDYDWFDPSIISPFRDAQGIPSHVPTGAECGSSCPQVLRVITNNYYNPTTCPGSQDPCASSTNIYSKRVLSLNPTPLILNASRETLTGPSDIRFGYDDQPFDNVPTKGNLTTKSVWDDVDNQWITTTHTYGLYGNLATTRDGRRKITSFFYDDPTHALPTSVTVNPENGTGTQTTSTAYDFSTGLVTRTTDPNNQITDVGYTNQLLGVVDPFGRPGIVTSPPVNGMRRTTKNFYADSSRTLTIASDLNASGDGLLKSEVVSDMLGRTIERHQYETANSYITVKTIFDTPNRTMRTSNPYRAGDTIVYTATVSDVIGRVVSVTMPDNATVSTSYSANTVTVTDQALNQRKSVSDALGRLVQVYEAPNNPDYNFLTSYDYDVLGNLRHVYQGSQTRTFAYDSLSRLRTADNPESKTVSYTYDENGNLKTRVDARSITTNYGYDGLNRIISRSYQNDPSNTPPVSYTYDSSSSCASNCIGRLASVSSAVSSYSYNGYDGMGRAQGASETITNQNGSQTYTISYSYDLASNVKSISYPSQSHVVNYNYDASGRLNDNNGAPAFSGNLEGQQRTYATGISYNARNQTTTERFGTDLNVYHQQDFNIRGQLYNVRASTINSSDDWNRGKITNYYTSTGNGNPGDSGPDNNGNVLRQQSWVPIDGVISNGTGSDDWYGYDRLNRLTSVIEHPVGNSWATMFRQQYLYDRWGNRSIDWNNTSDNVNNKPASVVPNTLTNRIYAPGETEQNHPSIDYDNAGNQTIDTYTAAAVLRSYDAENRMTSETTYNSVITGTYAYDGDGRRVTRIAGGIETWYVYGIGGELLAEYAANSNPAMTAAQREYGYRDGQLLITADGGGTSSGNQRVNFALAANGATATAQNYTQDSAFPGYYFEPGYAIDGRRFCPLIYSGNDANKFWRDEHGLSTWLEVDFNGSKSIDEIDLFTIADFPDLLTPTDPSPTQTFGANGNTAFNLQYWNGSGWTPVPGGSITNNNLVWRKVNFTAITTSKIRVVVNATTDGVARIAEVEAWGNGSLPPQPVNVAAAANGATATAQNYTQDGVFPGYSFRPSDAIDGHRYCPPISSGNDVNKFWRDEHGLSTWLEVDFNGSKSIDEIDLFTFPDYPYFFAQDDPAPTQTFSTYGITAFDLRYWNGTDWAVIPGSQVTNNNLVWRKVNFGAITTSKIRVYVNGAVDGVARLAEIEAWTGSTSQWSSVTFDSYRASRDFSSTQGQRNWYYLESTGGSMTFDAGNNRWQGSEQFSLLWSNGGHPGNNVAALRRWQSPKAGTIHISGNASDGDAGCGDGVIVSIKKGTQILWQQTIDNGNSGGFNYDLTTSVAAGDQISFVIDKRTDNSCDTTSFDPTITYTAVGSTGGTPPQIHWLVGDQLGTPRIILDQTGSFSGVTRHDYLPFGEELYGGPPSSPGVGGRLTTQGYSASDGVRQHFTQKERDNETGLDYFGARYFASTQGRFTSPDPLLASARAWAPQSWNRYSYVLNNPLKLIDPTGLADDDPQKKKDEQPPPPPIKVKVDVPPAQVFTNEKLPDGKNLTGVGSKVTVTLTDANDKPLAGATVTESNKAVPAQPGAATAEGPRSIVQNESTVTTSPEGTLKDYVVVGTTTNTPDFGKSGETVEGFKEFINETPIDRTTEQTLTVKAADGNSYQVTYQRTVTNVGPDGRLNEKVNENGVNVVVKTTTPVIKRLP